MKKQDRADNQNVAYKLMLAAWKIVDDVYAGTPRVRAATTEYLPQEPAEDSVDYNIRLKRSVFYNAFKRTVNALVGMVFRRDPQLAEDVSDEIIKHFENIDLSGTHGAVFLKQAFTEAVKDGHAFIYVEMPPPLAASESEAEEPTLADEMNADRRPYWIMYRAAQAVNWRTEVVNGKTKLAQITFEETTLEPDGYFGEKKVVRYRVLRPGSFEVWRVNGKKLELEYEGTTSLDEIPLAVVYGERRSDMESAPPLLDLALLNIKHYQLESDLDNVLHVAHVPILWAKGRDKTQKFQTVGVSTLIDLDGEHSAIGYAEVQGNALDISEKRIEKIEKQIVVQGLNMLADPADSPAGQTATGELIDSARSNSELSTMARSLGDAAELALGFHAKYLGKEEGGSIELNVEYDRLVLPVDKIRLLLEMVNDQAITLETLYELLMRAGELPADFDVQDELKKLYGSEETANQPAVVRDAQKDVDDEELLTEEDNNEDPPAAPPVTRRKAAFKPARSSK